MQDLRSAAMAMSDVLSLGREAGSGWKRLRRARDLLRYGMKHPSRGKARKPVDVPALVAKWVPVVRVIASAHARAELDQAEFQMDECLAPLLTAPVAQIRDFYARLVVALREDPGMPFYAWAMFSAWEEVVLKKAADSDVKQLRVEMATRIATMVEEPAKLDLRDAIIGALQWRPTESLQEIEKAVKAGGRPRMKGRESCLFLEIHVPGGDPAADADDEQPLARVML